MTSQMLSCQLLSSAIANQSNGFLYWVSHLLLGLPLFMMPSTFHNIIVFSSESFLLTLCRKYNSLNLVILLLGRIQDCFSSSTQLFGFLAVCGITKLFSSTGFKLIIFFLVSFFLCPAFTSIRTNQEYHQVDHLHLDLQWYFGALKNLSSSFITALPSLTFLLILVCCVHLNW